MNQTATTQTIEKPVDLKDSKLPETPDGADQTRANLRQVDPNIAKSANPISFQQASNLVKFMAGFGNFMLGMNRLISFASCEFSGKDSRLLGTLPSKESSDGRDIAREVARQSQDHGKPDSRNYDKSTPGFHAPNAAEENKDYYPGNDVP